VLHVPCYLRPLTATHQPAHLSFTSTGEALPPTQRSWELSRLSFLCFFTAGSLLLRLLGGSGCSAVRRLRLWSFSKGVLSSRPRLLSCSLRLPSAYAIRLRSERIHSHRDTKAPMLHVSTARLPCKSQSTCQPMGPKHQAWAQRPMQAQIPQLCQAVHCKSCFSIEYNLQR